MNYTPEELIIPPEASEQQRIEERDCFYAGAIAVFMLMETLGQKVTTEDDAVKALEFLDKELKEYSEARSGGKYPPL